MFLDGFHKYASLSEKDRKDVRNAGLAAGGVGAARHIGHEMYLNHREKKLKNSKSLNEFVKKLKEGDIILSGSTPRHSGAIRLSDMPKSIQNIGKAFGGKKSTVITTNSTLLNQLGGGSKYHAGVYTGKKRIAHMSTDTGAVSESLVGNKRFESTVRGQNVAAYRFKDSTKAERTSASNFAKRSVKSKVPYQKTTTLMGQVAGNLLSPVGKKASRKRKDGMVCNTLPIRAYEKRKFSKGEWTYSGDIRKAKNLVPIARRDVVKIPWHLRARNMAGQGSKGLKWGLGAAAATYGYKKFKEKTSPKK
jgi:hypothetical protein